MTDAVTLIYVTAPDPAAAQAIGRAIVAERLAACANILPDMRSIYWWQGKLEEAAETVLILKTVASAAERVIARVRALHGYQVPCAIALPVAAGNPDYLAWIRAEATG
ncbi:MAG TPA: divalent-cation tolerance protein CutA [Xanthobacteraceae bacterium]|nr:divalent-cation tolerance protein CutA [Xanthobacteraceae bacterium]